MNALMENLTTIICAVLASSGFWVLAQKFFDRKDSKTRMLVGLAHDRIMHLGMYYINQGYITNDEYENLYKYLYEPYSKMGGNGSAKRVMDEVKKLPLKEHH